MLASRLFFLPLLLAAELTLGCSNKKFIDSYNQLVIQDTIIGKGATNHPIKEIPDRYTAKASQEGNVVKIDYVTKSFDDSTKRLSKHAYVYLPNGYNENRRYNVFYLLHGGGGNAERYFTGEGQSSAFKRLLDHNELPIKK